MKVKGRVDRSDFGGAWVLVTDDGRRLALDTGDLGLLVEGQRVVIEGPVDAGGVGIGMDDAPVVHVDRWRPDGA